jgi:hypothetical protein
MKRMKASGTNTAQISFGNTAQRSVTPHYNSYNFAETNNMSQCGFFLEMFTVVIYTYIGIYFCFTRVIV